jgi:hypothetical protein
MLLVSGWLGGKMVYVYGVAVESPPEPAPEAPPEPAPEAPVRHHPI